MFNANFLFFAYGIIIACDMHLLDHLISWILMQEKLLKEKNDEIFIPHSHSSAVDKMNI